MSQLGPHLNQEQIRITKSRKEILSLLVENTYVKTGHFYRLLFNGSRNRTHERSVRRTLRDFFMLGYIRRARLIYHESPSPFLKYEFIYWLSKSGIKLARTLGFDRGLSKGTAAKSPCSLVHEDEITSFHL